MSDEPRNEATGRDGPEQPLGAFLRRQRELADVTLNQFASMAGISNAYLSQIERGLRRPSEAVLSSIAAALHLSADTIEAYAPAQSKAEVESEVLAAIERDPRLTARQRSALAEMYRSFVELNAQRRPRRRPPETKEASK